MRFTLLEFFWGSLLVAAVAGFTTELISAQRDYVAEMQHVPNEKLPRGVQLFRLDDGTRCVIYHRFDVGEVTCEWRSQADWK